ncbi:MAG: Crp/Fnr family transcriptional regulator [Armatimonadota bacterium]
MTRGIKQAVSDLELVPFLEGLDRKVLREIAVQAKRRKLKRGDEMRLPGNGAGDVVLVGRGKAHLLRRSTDGRRLSLGVVGDGALLASFAKKRSGEHEEYLWAVEDLVAYVLPRNVFERLLREHPEVAIGVTRALAEQSREREAQLVDLALRDVQHRAASVLGRLAECHGTVGSEGVTIRVRITHQDLADMIGCSRESVTVALGDLKREGLLGIVDRQFLIPDLERLKAIAALN